jgi:hypothetical protein
VSYPHLTKREERYNERMGNANKRERNLPRALLTVLWMPVSAVSAAVAMPLAQWISPLGVALWTVVRETVRRIEAQSPRLNAAETRPAHRDLSNKPKNPR